MKINFLMLCAVALTGMAVQAGEVQAIPADKTLDITDEDLKQMNYLDQLRYVDSHDPGLNAEDKKRIQLAIEMLSKRMPQMPKTSVNEKGETIPAYEDPMLMYELFKPAPTDKEVLKDVDFDEMLKNDQKRAAEAPKPDETSYQINVDQF